MSGSGDERPARGVAPKAAQRATWALGDFHRVAKDVVWPLGEVLVEACDIGSGQRVLDVGAGTGNLAIRAAEAGAEVVACDLTPELFEAGRAEAADRGVSLDWLEADAEELPFPDGSFDAVLSSIGAMFAPDHAAAAEEMLRVCRRGGTIGMINWTPQGRHRPDVRGLRPPRRVAAARRRLSTPSATSDPPSPPTRLSPTTRPRRGARPRLPALRP